MEQYDHCDMVLLEVLEDDSPSSDISPCIFLISRRLDLLPFYTSGFE